MIYTLGIEEMEGTQPIRDERTIYDYFEDKPSIQLDTEGNGSDPHSSIISCLQLGDAENQFVIDCRAVDVTLFKDLIENKQCVVQNGKHDYKMLKAKSIYMENMWDVMLAECVLYSGYEKWGYGLDDIVRRYLGKNLEKETRNSFLTLGDRPMVPRQVEYAARDVRHLDDVKALQTKKLEQLDLVRCHQLENQVIACLADMEYNGVGFAPDEWMRIASQTQIEAQELVEKLDSVILNDRVLSPLYKPEYVQQDLFGGNVRELSINYASPTQIMKICKQLGHEMESTDEQHLTKVKNKHEFFRVLIELRKKNKIVSTYGENFLGYINPKTHRIHTSYWQCVETGRTSSGSRRDHTPNIQNIPADIRFRNCFIPRKDCLWVSSDYSGQEMRLMAEASGEEGFISVLNSGEDIHSYAGSMMFKKPITKADKELRYQAKTVNFMVPYGTGPDKLAFELDVSPEEGQNLLDMYSKAFPALDRWLKNKGREAKRNGFSVTIGPIKRKRFYPDMEEAKTLRKAAKNGDKGLWKKIFTIEGQTERNGSNSCVQGGGADMLKEALVEVRKLAASYNNRYGEGTVLLTSTVHDEINSDVLEEVSKNFAKEKTEVMEAIGNRYVEKVKMVVDTTITAKWQK